MCDTKTASFVTQKSPGDMFGSDPFAPSSAKGTESSVPSLPPKHSKKQPPPRPAPPKSKSPVPAGKPKSDPFGDFGGDPFGGSDPFANSARNSSSNSFDAFANFSDVSFGKVS